MFLAHSCSSHGPEVMGRALVGYLFDNITPFQLSSLSELALTKVTNSLCEPALNLSGLVCLVLHRHLAVMPSAPLKHHTCLA